MKTLLSTIMVCFLAIPGIAQTTSTVNIIFRGITKTTNNYEVRIDDRRYFSNTNTNNSATVYKIAVNNILTGNRALKVYKLRNNSIATNASTQNTLIYSNNFVLREGYEMNITVRANGSVAFSEDMSEGMNPGTSAPMATVAFNNLKQSIQAQNSQAVRAERVRDAFINTNNHFTSAQVRQLLVMVTSESDKLDLAKLAYSTVTDPQNYAAIGNIFTSTSRRNEFAAYVQAKGDVTADPATRVAITDANFNTLVTNVKNKWSQSLKGEAIREALVNSNYYYTSTQVRQLMGLVSSETDRMDLIKLAYPVVSDTNNFPGLYDVFASTANRTEFNEFVVAKGGVAVNTGVRTLITSSNFNILMQNIQAKWSQALKTEAVRDAFVNTNNYYTTTQVRQLLGAVTSETDRMELVKLSYPAVSDVNNFGTLYDVFASTANRTEFNDFVISKGGVVVNTGVKAQMSAANFNILMNNIQAKYSQALKTDAVRDVFINTNNYFSTAQIRQLLTVVTSEYDRLELAKQSFRSVMDPAVFYQLGDLFTNATYRTEFNNYASAQTGVSANAGVRTPMSNSDFSVLVLTVRSNLLQLLKVQAERDIFANPNNFFTTAQVKQLIGLINSEPNRLELAKLSYRSITDPANFTQLNDLFKLQASKDELAAYVNTYQVAGN
ncbi:DUF4476 domain-containing protein [Daejeonella lutea]|uniref:DUF4476 domain-containing protein n=1 Tax=Daejeonella lutea TaxID=572036 RepID=A0A1T5EH29_9SPHI|nr:DUF4476 domain-containing protein [Daejeonella lutea]SKB83098.1 protein of unknown function [Daejeonella lutea]